MSEPPDAPKPPAPRLRPLVGGFTFAGAILGLGAFGLARSVILFGRTAGWLGDGVHAGPFHWWLLTGAGLGLAAGWLLVRLRGRD